MIDKALLEKIKQMQFELNNLSNTLLHVADEFGALCDEVYDNGSNDGYEEAEKERKTASETIASMPVIDDPVISDALKDVGL